MSSSDAAASAGTRPLVCSRKLHVHRLCWGPEVRALAVYLMDRQHLPVMRCAELLSDVLGAPVSAGWLCGVQLEAADRLEPFMDVVRAQLAVAAVLCADETSTASLPGKYGCIRWRLAC